VTPGKALPSFFDIDLVPSMKNAAPAAFFICAGFSIAWTSRPVERRRRVEGRRLDGSIQTPQGEIERGHSGGSGRGMMIAQLLLDARRERRMRLERIGVGRVV
jgi:hypothetical protein